MPISLRDNGVYGFENMAKNFQWLLFIDFDFFIDIFAESDLIRFSQEDHALAVGDAFSDFENVLRIVVIFGHEDFFVVLEALT